MRALAKYYFSLFVAFQIASAAAQTKTDQQLWLDYQFAVPFANSYLFDTEISYQTLLSNQDKWRSIYISPTIQRNILPRLDAIFSTPLYFTAQTSTYNTFEIRLSPALRFNITANKRIESRLLLRYDFRYVKPEGGDWQVSNRIRPLLEFIIAINGPNIYTDKLFYAITDAELFFVVDQNISERFANARKVRLGLGYRLNYRYRFEAIYQAQESRTTIDQPFDTKDTIFRFRFRMFFSPSQSVKLP